MVVVFGIGLGSCLVRFRCSNLCISGIDYYRRRNVFGLLRVNFIYGLWTAFIVFIVLKDIAHAAFLQLLVCKEPSCDGVEAHQVSWKYRELTHQAAEALYLLVSHSTVYTPLVACRRQCQRRPLSVAPKFHAKWSSPQAAGDLNISNYTILNTYKLHTREIWLFAARPDALNPLGVVNSMLAKIQLKTWTPPPTSNTLKTSQTRSLTHRHLLRRKRKYTHAPVLCWSIVLLSHGNATLRVAMSRTHKTIPTTPLPLLQSTNISSVGSRRKSLRHTVMTCWRKKRPLCVSEASKTGMASKCSWLACQIIRL